MYTPRLRFARRPNVIEFLFFVDKITNRNPNISLSQNGEKTLANGVLRLVMRVCDILTTKHSLRWLFKDRTKKQCDNIADTKLINFTAVKAIRSRVHSEDFDKISLTPKIISQKSHSAMDI